MSPNHIFTDTLYALTDKSGEKFLGYSASLVNPCGDWNNPSDCVFGYVRRKGSDELIPEEEISSAIKIDRVKCFAWYDETKSYQPFGVAKSEETHLDFETRYMRNMAHMFWIGEHLEELDRIVQDCYRDELYSWLLLNAKCSGAIYIGPDYSINSDGTIIINEDVKEVPQDIADKLKAGRQNMDMSFFTSPSE